MSERFTVTAKPSASSLPARIAVIAAHPDDEILGLGGRLAHIEARTLIHVTDGAPRDMGDARRAGFTTREEYARARLQELDRALAAASVADARRRALGAVDQEAAHHLVEHAHKIMDELECVDAVITHPCEGGHPDHDASAFIVQATCALLKRAKRLPRFSLSRRRSVQNGRRAPPCVAQSLRCMTAASRASGFMTLNILSVAYPFAPIAPDPVGGAEQVLARLDRALVEAGHRSTVIAVEGSSVAGRLVGITNIHGMIDEVGRAHAHSAVRRAILQVLEREPVDVVHLHGVDFAAYLPPPGIPVLTTLHLPLHSYPASALRPSRPDTWLLPVSPSQACALPGLRLLPPIENGVETPPLTVHARRRYTLTMGRVCPEKNFGDAIEAATRAGYPLLLAGSVFGYDEHERYFQTQIAPRLDNLRRWVGPIAGTRKRRLLAGARCLLVPSRVAETSSLVAMEALAAGTPVIAYRSGALPQIVEHGRTGYIVDDVEQMAEAIHFIDRITPEQCRRAAEQRFALSRMTAAYLSLYQRLADRQLEQELPAMTAEGTRQHPTRHP